MLRRPTVASLLILSLLTCAERDAVESADIFFLPVVAEEDDVESRRGVVVVEGRRKGKEVEVEVRVSMGMSWQRWSLPNAP